MDTRSTEDIHAATEKLLRDLETIVHDGEELLRAGAQGLTEKGLAAREKLSEALEVAKDTQRKIQAQVIAGAKATDSVIREHPYESLGVAFALGMLLGILTNRR